MHSFFREHGHDILEKIKIIRGYKEETLAATVENTLLAKGFHPEHPTLCTISTPHEGPCSHSFQRALLTVSQSDNARLGELSRKGLGGPIELEKARECFTPLAKKGDLTATTNLGIIHLELGSDEGFKILFQSIKDLIKVTPAILDQKSSDEVKIQINDAKKSLYKHALARPGRRLSNISYVADDRSFTAFLDMQENDTKTELMISTLGFMRKYTKENIHKEDHSESANRNFIFIYEGFQNYSYLIPTSMKNPETKDTLDKAYNLYRKFKTEYPTEPLPKIVIPSYDALLVAEIGNQAMNGGIPFDAIIHYRIAIDMNRNAKENNKIPPLELEKIIKNLKKISETHADHSEDVLRQMCLCYKALDKTSHPMLLDYGLCWAKITEFLRSTPTEHNTTIETTLAALKEIPKTSLQAPMAETFEANLLFFNPYSKEELLRSCSTPLCRHITASRTLELTNKKDLALASVTLANMHLTESQLRRENPSECLFKPSREKAKELLKDIYQKDISAEIILAITVAREESEVGADIEFSTLDEINKRIEKPFIPFIKQAYNLRPEKGISELKTFFNLWKRLKRIDPLSPVTKRVKDDFIFDKKHLTCLEILNKKLGDEKSSEEIKECASQALTDLYWLFPDSVPCEKVETSLRITEALLVTVNKASSPILHESTEALRKKLKEISAHMGAIEGQKFADAVVNGNAYDPENPLLLMEQAQSVAPAILFKKKNKTELTEDESILFCIFSAYCGKEKYLEHAVKELTYLEGRNYTFAKNLESFIEKTIEKRIQKLLTDPNIPRTSLLHHCNSLLKALKLHPSFKSTLELKNTLDTLIAKTALRIEQESSFSLNQTIMIADLSLEAQNALPEGGYQKLLESLITKSEEYIKGSPKVEFSTPESADDFYAAATILLNALSQEDFKITSPLRKTLFMSAARFYGSRLKELITNLPREKDTKAQAFHMNYQSLSRIISLCIATEILSFKEALPLVNKLVKSYEKIDVKDSNCLETIRRKIAKGCKIAYEKLGDSKISLAEKNEQRKAHEEIIALCESKEPQPAYATGQKEVSLTIKNMLIGAFSSPDYKLLQLITGCAAEKDFLEKESLMDQICLQPELLVEFACRPEQFDKIINNEEDINLVRTIMDCLHRLEKTKAVSEALRNIFFQMSNERVRLHQNRPGDTYFLKLFDDCLLKRTDSQLATIAVVAKTLRTISKV